MKTDFIKKSFLNILFVICLTFGGQNIAFATDFEDFTITTIAQPKLEEKQTNEVQEEKWIELEWNKWRAKIVNIIYDNGYCVYELYRKAAYGYYFDVDNNQKISDIVICYFPPTTLNIDEKSAELWWMTPDAPFYTYSLKHDVFFELKTTKKVRLTKDNLINIVHTAKTLPIVSSKVPVAKAMKMSANNIKRLETVFKRALVYPDGSKRKSVVVTAVYRSSREAADYTAESFNDIEKIKVTQ